MRDTNAAKDTRWFAGKSQDAESKLSYFGARYYDPLLGRFMGIDPVGVDENNVHSHNRYAYANNNPYKFVDPDGREPVTLTVLAINSGVGAIIGGVVAGGINASIQYASTGDVQFKGMGGVIDAAGDGALVGLLGGIIGGAEVGAAAGAASAAERTAMVGGVEVSTSSAAAARGSLEKAGFPGRAVTNEAGTEAGTIHNIAGKKMDVRVMDGGPKHSPRIVTSVQGSRQAIKPDGTHFGNVSKAVQREGSHIKLEK